MNTASIDRRDFVMAFVSHSEKWKSQFVEKWQEVMANHVVEPQYTRNVVTTPYSANSQNRIYQRTRKQIILKDPETHKIVMTYASKLARALFGDPAGEYVQAEPVGFEDTLGAKTVTRLERYIFGRQGHFRTMIEALVDMLTMGTAVIESPWRYEERYSLARSVETHYGVETSSESAAVLPYYDDVCFRCIDNMDFFPDPSRYRIYDMAGVAKRFRMTASQAKRTGIYDQAAVAEAARTQPTSQPRDRTSWREGIDQPVQNTAMSEFKDMVGYEYWGETPWGRRVITVLNNVVVRDDDYPYADPTLPFHTFIINPMNGRFYGLAPAEVVRYDQSFADAIKMLLAEAIVRQVHPPIAIDSDSDIGPDGMQKLREWRIDAPISLRGGPAAIGTLRYDANVANGFAMLSGLKVSMQDGSGASGGIQGEEGPDREAATVGAQRLQFAMDRPELAAMILETECLPELGLAALRRCQQFLDTEGLRQRIGEMPESIWIGDIMGQFDIRFVGSRKAIPRQQKLQQMDRLISLSAAVPEFRMSIPWTELAQTVIGDWMQLPEVAALAGSPEVVKQNTALSALNTAAGGGQGGAGQNGAPTASEPPGMLPAQASGGLGE